MKQKINMIIGDNGRSKIAVTNNGVRVLAKPIVQGKIPIGVVTIVPGIQLEIGRSFDEFVDCIQCTNKPLAFNLKVKDTKKCITIWELQRLPTGNVEEATICNITVIRDEIYSVQFNQNLAYDKNYTRYEKLSILHQVTLGKPNENNTCSRGISTINKLTGIDYGDMITRQFKHGVEIKIKGYKISYIFFTDKQGYMNLLSIGKNNS